MDDNYKHLADAIVAQAVKDYKKLLKTKSLTGLQQRQKDKIEEFFRSGWGEALTDLDGEFCIEKIKENVARG